MGRPRRLLIPLAAAAAAAALALARHFRRAHSGRRVRGGVLVGDPALYDAVAHRFLLGTFLQRIAPDVAAVAPEGARVREVGAGPAAYRYSWLAGTASR